MQNVSLAVESECEKSRNIDHIGRKKVEDKVFFGST